MSFKLSRFLTVLKRAFRNWYKHEPVRQSSVIAYYAVFSVPALLVMVINVAGLFYEKSQIRDTLNAQIKTAINPDTAEKILNAVDRAGEFDKGVVSAIIGVVVILVGSLRIFIHLRKSFNTIWDTENDNQSFMKELKKMVFSMGLVLTLGFLLLLSMVITTVISSASDWLQRFLPDFIVYLFFAIEFIFSLVLISALFALMYHYLPDCRPQWPPVIRGAVLTALLFMLLKTVLSFVFSRINPAEAYGAASYIILVLIWMSAVSMLIFFGARFIRQFELYSNDKKQDVHHS